jgi:hypothetical protein
MILTPSEIKLFTFKNHFGVITDKYENTEIEVSDAFEYQGRKYVVITKGLVKEGQYTIMGITPIQGSKHYNYEFTRLPDNEFSKVCAAWEKYKYGGE